MAGSTDPTGRGRTPLGSAPNPDAEHTRRLMYSIKGAAELLSLSPSTLGGMLRGNVMPAIKLGNRWYIARADLEAYVDHLRSKAEPYTVA
jgi:excisionase family DNA binding protein